MENPPLIHLYDDVPIYVPIKTFMCRGFPDHHGPPPYNCGRVRRTSRSVQDSSWVSASTLDLPRSSKLSCKLAGGWSWDWKNDRLEEPKKANQLIMIATGKVVGNSKNGSSRPLWKTETVGYPSLKHFIVTSSIFRCDVLTLQCAIV
jgi:hypothetical protein